jgi:CDP-diacylglycerol--glycerol-3-phosphate 3-phosphatidyltransferase
MNAMRRVPNFLTVFRLILAMVFPLLPATWWFPALLTGAASEFLDGFLARRFNVTTKFGQFLDPIADKAFVVIVSLTFVGNGLMSISELLMVAIRDVVVTFCALWLIISRRQNLFEDLKPHILGKIATAFQITLLINISYFSRVEGWILYPAIMMSALAAIVYFKIFFQLIMNEERIGI